MKNLYLTIFLFLAFSCNQQSERSEREPDTETAQAPEEQAQSYGATISEDSIISTSAMLTQLGTQDSVRVTVKGEITSTCKMKGCWMNIKLPEGKEMRVTFKDYGFFVPKEGVEGKTAIFEGWVTKAIISEEDRKHFAEDAGKSEEELATIVGDEEQLAFVADGVKILE